MCLVRRGGRDWGSRCAMGAPPSLTPAATAAAPPQSALFDFANFLTVILLFICTCTYLHGKAPDMLDRNKKGFPGVFWKAARIGERLSPYISVGCLYMALHVLFIRG